MCGIIIDAYSHIDATYLINSPSTMLTLYYMGLSNNTLCLIDNGENNLSKIPGIGTKKEPNHSVPIIKKFLAVHCAPFNGKFIVRLD